MFQLIGSVASIITLVVLLVVLVGDKFVSGSKQYACTKGHSSWGKKLSFCYECGAHLFLVHQAHCPDGHEVEDRAKFCPKCGKAVNGHRHIGG